MIATGGHWPSGLLMTPVLYYFFAAYNGHKFDGPVLIRGLAKHGLSSSLEGIVKNFIDPYIFVKEYGLHLQRETKQSDVLKYFNIATADRDAHNALYDALHLKELCIAIRKDYPKLFSDTSGKHIITLDEIRLKVLNSDK